MEGISSSPVILGVAEDDVMMQEEIHAIALRRTRESSKPPLHEAEADDPEMDPNSSRFDLQKWLKIQLRRFEDRGIRPFNTGVVFTKLSVYGGASVLQVQHTVASVFTSMLLPFLSTKKPPRKTILHDINGYVGHGEMLLVLGRPGAGCSTFLRSVASEHYDLELDKHARIHFSGIPQEQMKTRFRGDLVYNPELENRK